MTTSLLATAAATTLLTTPCFANVATGESLTADSGSFLFYGLGFVALIGIYLMSRRIDAETDD